MGLLTISLCSAAGGFLFSCICNFRYRIKIYCILDEIKFYENAGLFSNIALKKVFENKSVACLAQYGFSEANHTHYCQIVICHL